MTPWTVVYQAPLPAEFTRQEYWSGLPFPPPGESSQPRDQNPVSCVSCIGRRTPYPFEPSRPTSCPSGADPDHSLPPHPTRGTSELRVRAQQERTQEKQQPPLLGPSPASAGFNNCPPQRSGDMINSDSRIIKMLPPSIWH